MSLRLRRLKFSFLIRALFYFLMLNVSNVDGTATERKLIQALLTSYNTLERPVAKDSDVLSVLLDPTLVRLMKVDELNLKIQMNLQLRMEWNDANLKWNPNEFGGIMALRIPSEKIWTPDIHVNNLIEYDVGAKNPLQAIVKHSGIIMYTSSMLITVTCNMTLNDYPFDEHKCPMNLSSRTMNELELDLEIASDSVNTSSLIQGFEWEVVDFLASKNVMILSCCPQPFVDATYTLSIRRNGSHIFCTAYLINFLVCSLILISVLFPPSSGQKINMSILSLLLCTYASKLYNPCLVTNSNTPQLAIYFERLLVLACINLLINAVVFYIYNRKGSMPAYVKKLLVDRFLPIFSSFCPIRYLSYHSGTIALERVGAVPDVHELICQVENLKHAILQGQQESDGIMNHWNYLAIVVDRFLFVFWTVFIPMFAAIRFPSYAASKMSFYEYLNRIFSEIV